MKNGVEAAWVVGAIVAVGFATFMLVFGVVAFAYWTVGLIGLV